MFLNLITQCNNTLNGFRRFIQLVIMVLKQNNQSELSSKALNLKSFKVHFHFYK